MRNEIARKLDAKRGFLTEQAVASLVVAGGAGLHDARGIITSNIAGYTNVANLETIAGFTVTASTINDGLAYIAGQRLLLIGQTVAAQNGLWVVGTVTGTTAPLTRPADWMTTDILFPGTLVAIADGTLGQGTIWSVVTLSTLNPSGVWTQVPITIGTSSQAFENVATNVGLSNSSSAVDHAVRGVAIGAAAVFPGGGTYAFPAGGPESVTGFTGVTGGTAIDGVTYTVGQRLLVQGLTNAANGIWEVASVGAPLNAANQGTLVRPADWATGALIPAGTTIESAEGNIGQGTIWQVETASTVAAGAWTFVPWTVGTTTGILSIQPIQAPQTASVLNQSASAPVHLARGVVLANITTTNFTLAATDLTFVAGDRVLLVGQTSAIQNGIYVCGQNGSGSGGAGTALLTRAADMLTGSLAQPMSSVYVSEGTQGKLSQWILNSTGALTIGTNNLQFICPNGNWVAFNAAVPTTQTGPATNCFVGALLLSAKYTGIFDVSVDMAISGDVTAKTITCALLTDTSAAGAIGGAGKLAAGVSGVGAGAQGGLFAAADGEIQNADAAGGGGLTYNAAAWSTAPQTHCTQVFGTLTGLLTTNGSGQNTFTFKGTVYNATGAVKTAFALGNTVALGVKITGNAGLTTLTVAQLNMSMVERASL